MLLELRDYLRQRKSASLQQMAWHFRQSPEMMRCCLAHWISKGKVCRIEKPPACGTRCQMCRPEAAEIYCWQKVSFCGRMNKLF